MKKIGSPVFWAQPSFTGTVAKFLVQLNRSFLRAALPHPNLDGKIGSPVLQAHIFPYRNCVEKFCPIQSVPSFSRTEFLTETWTQKLAAQFFAHSLPLRELCQNFLVQFSPKFFSAQHSLTESWKENFLPPVFFTHSFLTETWVENLVQASSARANLFSFTAVAANNLAQCSPSSSRSTPLYRSLEGKIGSPILLAQPSLTGTVEKFLVQLNRSFLCAALPHRNLDGKIGSPVLRGTIFPLQELRRKLLAQLRGTWTEKFGPAQFFGHNCIENVQFSHSFDFWFDSWLGPDFWFDFLFGFDFWLIRLWLWVWLLIWLWFASDCGSVFWFNFWFAFDFTFGLPLAFGLTFDLTFGLPLTFVVTFVLTFSNFICFWAFWVFLVGICLKGLFIS